MIALYAFTVDILQASGALCKCDSFPVLYTLFSLGGGGGGFGGEHLI